eukprot:TRINITY_DN5974_c0_g1_i1.p1 TRINITY_DN5974_c0_g1~~TRINITY_DN5974_c0_g1_i1.p1  ORF type:complete len:91 (-),score=10.20 TRINITY_DN5974_c0_g1_i1:74-346(-)
MLHKGLTKLALSHFESIHDMASGRDRAECADLFDYGIQAAWRLSEWELLDQFLESSRSLEPSFTRQLGACIMALRNNWNAGTHHPGGGRP